ncbi:MAG: hypothetical protein ACJAX3_001529 [Patiriisocius sp.]|jgi:hypothetical protein
MNYSGDYLIYYHKYFTKGLDAKNIDRKNARKQHFFHQRNVAKKPS